MVGDEAPSRPASQEAHDDSLLPFAVEGLDLRGRLVRLGPAVHSILTHYDYPPLVARLLGEAAALTVLLGSMLESHGRFQLQTKSDGAVDMLVVDFEAPGRMRGFARFNAETIANEKPTTPGQLLGRGHLALTIEREEDASRYQGVVALEGDGLAEAAHHLFSSVGANSELREACRRRKRDAAGRSWRAGGLLLQYLPTGGLARMRDLPPGDAPEIWRRRSSKRTTRGPRGSRSLARRKTTSSSTRRFLASACSIACFTNAA